MEWLPTGTLLPMPLLCDLMEGGNKMRRCVAAIRLASCRPAATTAHPTLVAPDLPSMLTPAATTAHPTLVAPDLPSMLTSAATTAHPTL